MTYYKEILKQANPQTLITWANFTMLYEYGKPTRDLFFWDVFIFYFSLVFHILWAFVMKQLFARAC